MTFTNTQKHQLNKLMDHREEINQSLFHIERILKEHFPKEYNIAYQHWIPQIITALDSDDRWLPRGQFNMKHTLDRLLDQSQSFVNKGVYKHI